jgi:putative ABC transport system substrate-binding protein
MRRRDFITLAGGAAAAWPLVGRAQQARPVIGYLFSGSAAESRDRITAFHKGLKEAGFEEGRNVTIENRWGNNQLDRVPELAADLIRRGVAIHQAERARLPLNFPKSQTTVVIGFADSSRGRLDGSNTQPLGTGFYLLRGSRCTS